MMKRKFVYVTDCTLIEQDQVEDLHKMIEEAEGITYATMTRRCDLTGLIDDLGYVMGSEKGLHLKDDWHVSYHKSRFLDATCYYLKHSAIEHIFLHPFAADVRGF